MISLLRRYHRSLFIATIAIFLIGTFVGLGSYFFTSRDLSGTVAQVGSTKISTQSFMTRVNQYADAMRSKGADLPEEAMKEIKQGMLRDMIVDELLQQKADELGIVVTDAELARDVQNTPAFQRGGAFSQDAYYAAIRTAYHETPEMYEVTRRKQIKSAKLKQLIYQTAKLTPDELRAAYASEHKGSMKGFEKDQEAFASQQQQRRALDLINFYLRQLSTQVDIKTYLDQSNSGV